MADQGDALLEMADDLMELRPGEEHFAPMDDLSRYRLLEGVLDEVLEAPEQSRRRNTRWAWICAAAALLATVSGAIAVARLIASDKPEPQAPAPAGETIESLPGGSLLLAQGLIIVNDGEAIDLDPKLEKGTTLATQQGRALLLLPTGIRVMAEEGTRLKIARLDTGAIDLGLERGRILASISPRSEGPTLSVSTARGRVVVTGTIFSVESGSEAKVEVFRGSVRIEDDGLDRRSVRASSYALLGSSETGKISEEREEQVKAVGGALDLLGGEDAASVSISSIPPGASVIFGGVDLGRTPVAARLRAGHRDLTILLDGYSPVRERMEVAPGIPLERTFELSTEAEPEDSPGAQLIAASRDTSPGTGPTPAGATARSAAELLREAQDLRAAKHWAAAARTFRRLLEDHPRSPEASAATISLANIEARHLGRPSAALALFEHYLEGGGPLAPEAAWGRISALETLGREAEVVSALEDFLARHPESMRAGAAEAKLATLRGRSPR